MAEEKKAIELDDEALEEVAGGDGTEARTYSVYCRQCGGTDFMETGLSGDSAKKFLYYHRSVLKHNAGMVSEL